MLREKAYKLVQTQAMKSWEEEGDFRAAISADPEVKSCLNPAQLDLSFALDRQLANVDKIFARVFGG